MELSFLENSDQKEAASDLIPVKSSAVGLEEFPCATVTKSTKKDVADPTWDVIEI